MQTFHSPNRIKSLTGIYLLSLGVMVPDSSFAEMEARTLQASLAKSKSLTSVGDTDIKAKASLSSFTWAQPT